MRIRSFASMLALVLMAISNVALATTSITPKAQGSTGWSMDFCLDSVTGNLRQCTYMMDPVTALPISPFPAGGSIGNTSFGISGTLPAFASTPAFTISGTLPAFASTPAFTISGTLPAFAATPTFNLGTLNGAATAAGVATVNTTLGTPMQNSGGTVGISGTLPAFAATPTVNLGTIGGASTAAKQPALGTAGTASTDVLSVQGIAGMTALKTDGSAVTQPVSAASFPLPTGASSAANQTNASQKTQIVDGSGNVIASTSNNLDVQCANCSGSGVSTGDEASFTAGTSLFAGSGGFFQTTPTLNALTTGQQGMFQATANRALFINPRNAAGAETATAAAPFRIDPTGTTIQPVSGTVSSNATQVGTWTVQPGNTANTTAWKVDGSAVTQPMSAASLPLPTGASTSANQPTAAAQGSTTSGQTGHLMEGAVTTAAPSYTTGQTSPFSLDPAGNVRVNIMAGAAAGGTSSNFAAAFPSAGTAIGAKNGANMVNLVADGSNNLDVNCVVGCAGGTTSNASSAVATSATNGATVAWLYLFNGTTWDQAQADASKNLKVMVNAALPTGANSIGQVTANAGTNLNTSSLALESGGNLATLAGAITSAVEQSNVKQINGVVPLMGNGVTGTGSLRVTIASDTSSNTNAFKVDGSAVTQPVSAASLPLPAGASTAAKQAALGTAGTASSDVISVQGIASMTPLKVDASATSIQGATPGSAPPSGANTVMIGALNGANAAQLKVDGSSNLDVNCTVGCAGGSTSNASSAVATSSTNGATVAWLYLFNGTTWDQAQADGSKNLKVNVAAGSVTANAGTNLNTSALALETGGNLATIAGAITSAVEQTNEKQINGVAPLMGNGVSGTGSQRVNIASDNTAFSVNAVQSGTWTVQPGNTANTTAWKVDGSAVTQPVSAASLPLPTGAATSANQPTAAAQGSTTSGQTGPIIQGAVTTAAPSYTTGQTSPLSLDTSGLLRVNVAAGGGTGGTSSSFAAAFPATGTAIGAKNGANMVNLAADGSGNLDVVVAAALPTGANTVGAVTQASGPWTQNVTQFSGTAATAKAASTAPALADTSLVVAQSPNANPVCTSVIAINQTASTDLATLTNFGYICSIILDSATAQSFSLVEGTGTVCATGIAALIGGTTASFAVAANGGFSAVADRPWLKMKTSADHLCLLQSGAGNISGIITYQDHT